MVKCSPSDEKGAAKKKPFTRVRNGCETCKRRRVRCDEQRPVCVRCVVHGSQCTYKGPAWHMTTQASGNDWNPRVVKILPNAPDDPFDSLPVKMEFKSAELFQEYVRFRSAYRRELLGNSGRTCPSMDYNEAVPEYFSVMMLFYGAYLYQVNPKRWGLETTCLYHKAGLIRAIRERISAGNIPSWCADMMICLGLIETGFGENEAASTHTKAAVSLLRPGYPAVIRADLPVMRIIFAYSCLTVASEYFRNKAETYEIGGRSEKEELEDPQIDLAGAAYTFILLITDFFRHPVKGETGSPESQGRRDAPILSWLVRKLREARSITKRKPRRSPKGQLYIDSEWVDARRWGVAAYALMVGSYGAPPEHLTRAKGDDFPRLRDLGTWYLESILAWRTTGEPAVSRQLALAFIKKLAWLETDEGIELAEEIWRSTFVEGRTALDIRRSELQPQSSPDVPDDASRDEIVNDCYVSSGR